MCNLISNMWKKIKYWPCTCIYYVISSVPSICLEAAVSASYTKVIKRLVDLYTCWPVLYLPVGTVVQCSLHPLGGGCHQWVLDQTDQMSRQSTAPLTPHRITLIWHSTGTYNQRTESPEKPVSISSTCNLLALFKLIFFSKSTESETYFQWTNFDTS